MKTNHILALIVAYYLSRFNQAAYNDLGFGNHNQTHREIGRYLGVNPNSVKNMRDEFDPIHDNPRAGWHQRPLRPSRRKLVEAFQDLSEMELREIVLEILTNPSFALTDETCEVLDLIQKTDKPTQKGKRPYIVRGPTGRRAEEYFISFHRDKQLPVPGTLYDTRDYGTGYDFEIHQPSQTVFIEVKGLDAASGGVVFTSKEWQVARKEGICYYLVLVRNLTDVPEVQIIQDPARSLTARRSMVATVQVRWSITDTELTLYMSGA